MSAERRGASENKQSFNIRQKMDGMQFDGMAPDNEPQDLPENRPRLAINVRYDGGISARPGFTQVCDLNSLVTGMHDHQNGAPRGLYISLYNFVDDISQGNQIVLYNKEQTPTSKVLTAYANGTRPPIGIYGSRILFGPASYLREIRSIDVNTQPPIWQVPVPTYGKISAIIEHEGEALVALWLSDLDPGGDCAVFSYDGTTFTNSLTGLSIVRGFARYRDKAIAIFDGTPNEIRVRDSSGAWTTVTPGAGTVAVPYPNVCASYLDKCYIPTGGEDIFTLDETNTLTRLTPATTGVVAGSSVLGMAVLDRNLYYLWMDNGISAARLGRYDGSAWNAYYQDFFNDGDAPVDLVALKQYLGGLVVVGSPAVDVFGVYSSPGLDISGTWTGEILNTTGTDLSITSALVY